MILPTAESSPRYAAVEPGCSIASSVTRWHDVRIFDHQDVADAIQYAAILVTSDGGSKSQPGGILGHRDALTQRFNVWILTPTEAVDYGRAKIRERDDFNPQVVREFGGQLPDWTWKD